MERLAVSATHIGLTASSMFGVNGISAHDDHCDPAFHIPSVVNNKLFENGDQFLFENGDTYQFEQ